MIYFTHISISLHPAFFLVELKSGTIFLFVGLLVAVFLAGFYFVLRNYKKSSENEIESQNNRIRLLKDYNESLVKEKKALSEEITVLQLKLREAEIEKRKLIEEKQKLELENKLLKDQIQKFKKEDDIIIEYYMNENSGD